VSGRRAPTLTAALAGAGLLTWASTAYAQFTFLSQNSLHLGWGQKNYDYLRELFANFDVILVQELMPKYATINDPANPNKAKNAKNVYVPLQSEALGPRIYRERYGFFVSDAVEIDGKPNQQVVQHPNNLKVRFSRPPAGILVRKNSNAPWTWLVNYHAIYGRHIGLRRGEAEAMAEVYTYFLGQRDSQGNTHNRVLMCGDWNLPATDQAYGPLLNVVNRIEPDEPSSLTPAGLPSSAYDHCAWNNNNLAVNLGLCRPDNAGCSSTQTSFPTFRQTVSDHLGITGVIQ